MHNTGDWTEGNAQYRRLDRRHCTMQETGQKVLHNTGDWTEGIAQYRREGNAQCRRLDRRHCTIQETGQKALHNAGDWTIQETGQKAMMQKNIRFPNSHKTHLHTFSSLSLYFS